jgi:hypothetical protein
MLPRARHHALTSLRHSSPSGLRPEEIVEIRAEALIT